MTVPQLLTEAVHHHQAGRLAEAEARYRLILAEHPDHPHALQLLGVVAHQVGQHHAAVELIQRAISFGPDVPEYHNNLGEALQQLGRTAEAIAAYRTAIKLKPAYPEAHHNLGNALKAKGDLKESVAAYRSALRLAPEAVATQINLGLVLVERGELDEATATFRAAIALQPGDAESHNHLGIALKLRGDYSAAQASFEAALRLNPGLAEAHNNLGVVLQEMGRPNEAAAACRGALHLRPNYADAHSNLGNALMASGRIAEAIGAFKSALGLAPQSAEAHIGLGAALQAQGNLDAASEAFETALNIKPDHPDALNNLGNALKELGEIDRAIACFRRAITVAPNHVAAHDNLLLTLNYHPDYDAKRLAEEHDRWRRSQAVALRRFVPHHENDRTSDRRLRIGYVSGDFRDHAVARFLLPLLRCHDPGQFEIFCYSNVIRPDETTEQFRSLGHHWRPIAGQTDDKVAEQIRTDQIDILVDLAAHTAGNRLRVFAQKPAPVQVTWLAYAGSTGLDTIDYRLTDPHLDPPGFDPAVYSEQSVILPETYWCCEPPRAHLEVNSLPALTSHGIAFGCLNSSCKFSPAVVDTWARILQQIPGSALILHAPPGKVRQRLLARFRVQGIDGARIKFVGRQSLALYLASYQQIDIGLDPYPYTGGTTTCDALWMGVPVVTRRGQTAVSRGGASLLSNLGLPELIAQTENDYIRIARDLAEDLERLAQLRATLRGRMQASPLMDAPRFASNVEAAYRQMWRSWCDVPRL